MEIYLVYIISNLQYKYNNVNEEEKDNTDHELITPMKKKIDEYIITLSSNFKNKKI